MAVVILSRRVNLTERQKVSDLYFRMSSSPLFHPRFPQTSPDTTCRPGRSKLFRPVLALFSLAFLMGGLCSTASAQTNAFESWEPPDAGVLKLKSPLNGSVTFRSNAPTTPWRVLLEGKDIYGNDFVYQVAAGRNGGGTFSFSGSVPNDGTLHNFSGDTNGTLPAGYTLSLYTGDAAVDSPGNLQATTNGYAVSVTPDLLIPPVKQIVKLPAGANAVLVTNTNGSVSIASLVITNSGQGYSTAQPPTFTFTPRGGVATNAAVTNAVAIDPVTGSLLSATVGTNNTYAGTVTNIVVGIAAPPRYQTQSIGGLTYGLNESTGLYTYAYNSGDAVRFKAAVANNTTGDDALQSRPLGPRDLYRLDTVLTTDPIYQGTAGSDDMRVFFQDCSGDLGQQVSELSKVRSVRVYNTPGPLPEYGVVLPGGDVYGARIYQPLPGDGYLDIGEQVQLEYDVLMPRNFTGIYFAAAKVDALNAIAEPLTAFDGVYKESPPLQTNGLVNNNTFVSAVATRIQVLSSSKAPNISIASQVTDSTGAPIVQSDNDSDMASVDEQGKYVVFESYATDLAVPQSDAAQTYGTSVNSTPPLWNSTNSVSTNNTSTNGVSNGLRQIFRRNTATRSVEIVSVSGGGAQATADARNPCVNSNGVYVAFESAAPNLVDNDSGGNSDIFVRDYTSYNTLRMSVNSAGVQGNASSVTPSISGSGRFVAFASSAGNLVDPPRFTASISNGQVLPNFTKVFDGTFGYATTNPPRVIFSGGGGAGAAATAIVATNGTNAGKISGLLWTSGGSNYTSAPTITIDPPIVPAQQLFVHDRDTDTNSIFDEAGKIATYVVSVNTNGALADGWCDTPKISEDGNYVAFVSYSGNMPAASNGYQGVVYRVGLNQGEAVTTNIAVVSKNTTNALANALSYEPAINGDGSQIAFTSMANNLSEDKDDNGFADVFLRDFTRNKTVRVSESLNRFAIGHIAFPSTTAGLIPQQDPDNNPSDGDQIVLADGLKSVTFRFTYVPASFGPITYDVLIGDTTSQTRDNLVAAINAAAAAGYLGISAVVDSPSNTDGFYFNPPLPPGEADYPSLLLFCVSTGAQGNIPISVPDLTDQFSKDGVTTGFFPGGTLISFSGMAYGGTQADYDAGEIDGVPAGSTMPSIDRSGMVVAFRSTMKTLDVYNRSFNGLNGLRQGALISMLFNDSANVYVRQRDVDGELGSGVPDAAGNVDTERVSVDRFGYPTLSLLDFPSSANSHKPALSANGRYVAFSSDSENTGGLVSGRTNLTPQDTNQKRDVFVYDRAVVSTPTPINGNHQPQVVLTEPIWLAGNRLAVGSTVILNATVEDADEDIPKENVQFAVNGILVTATDKYGSTYSASYTFTQVFSSNSVRARATDSAREENSTGFSQEFTFGTRSPIPRPASATMLPLTLGTIVEVGKPVSLSARVSEPCDEVRFYANGCYAGSAGPSTDGVATLAWYPPVPANGVKLTALAANNVIPLTSVSTLGTQNSPGISVDILGVDSTAQTNSPQDQVVDVFSTVLSRLPDGTENQYWVDAVDGGTSQSDMVFQLVYEDEYTALQNKLFGYYDKMRVAPVYNTYLNQLGDMTLTAGLSGTNAPIFSADAGYPAVNGSDAPYGATTGDATAAQKIISSAAFARVNPGVQTKNLQDFMNWYFSRWPSSATGPANLLLAAMNSYAPSTEAKGYAASFINALNSVNGYGLGSPYDYQLKATSLKWLYTGVWQSPTIPAVTNEVQLQSFIENLLAVSGVSSTSPKLFVTDVVSGFAAAQGVASEPAAVYISAANIVGDVTVTAPAGFEVSLDGVNYLPTVTYTPASGSSIVPRAIYVRLSSIASAGPIESYLQVSAPGAGFEYAALEAQVSGNPFAPVGDVYTGIFGDGVLSDGFAAKNGLLSITAKSDGTYLGTLQVGGGRFKFSGRFDANTKTASTTVVRKGQSPVLLNLDFDTQRPNQRITGIVTIGDAVSAVVALPKGFSGAAGSIHPKAGKRYNVVLPAPDAGIAHGYASLYIAPNGTVTFTGQTGDGARFNAPTAAVDGDKDGIDGYWIIPVYAAPYGAGGCLTGEFYIAKNEAAADPDVTGNLGWIRPAKAGSLAFPAGFRRALSPLGQAYTAPATGVSVISGTSSTASFSMRVDPFARALAAPVTQPGSWPASNIPLLAPPVQNGLTLAFAPASGLVTGTIKTSPAATARALGFQGVMIPQGVTLPGSALPLKGVGVVVYPSGGAEVEISD